MTEGIVVRVGPGTAQVRLPSGKVIAVNNALNQRVPLGSTVVLTKPSGSWFIVGRRR